MSIRWMDGFDRYATSGSAATALSKKYSVGSAGSGITVASGRYNGYGLTFHGDSKGGQSFLRTSIFTFTGSKAILGCNFYSGTGTIRLTFPQNGFFNLQYEYINLTSSTIEWRSTDYDNGVGPKASIGIASNAWYQVEFVFTETSRDSNEVRGTGQLYVNGVLVTNIGNPTGGWRLSFPQGPINLGFQGQGILNGTSRIDDFYFLDDIAARGEPVDRIGSTARISTLYPSAAKNGTDVWTPTNAASATLAVKQVPIGAAYISAPGINSVQEFEFDNLPISFTDVKGLQLNTMASGDTGASFKHMVNNTVVLSTTLITTPTLRITPLTVIDTTAVNAIQAGVSS